jgi:membrane protease YdiL (CAAX protease family)
MRFFNVLLTVSCKKGAGWERTMTSENAEHYFKQTQSGDSRWWVWLITFWLSIIAWVFLSGIVAQPIPGIVRDINPELLAAFDAVQLQQVEVMSQAENIRMILIVMGSVILGLFFFLLSRVTRGKISTLFGCLCGIFAAASTVSAVKVYPALNNADANAAFLPLIGESAIAYALMLLTFPVFLGGLYLCQKFLHKRTIISMHTAASKIDWRRMFFAIGVTWSVLGVISVIMHVTGISPLRVTFDPSRFFAFALATLIFIPLQSGTEEIIFRGYLNQAFGHFISNKWVVFIITSALFAAMHLSNPESLAGAEKGGFTHLLVMSQYFLFGFILSVVVYFEGGLEAAIGVHAGNNMFAAMFINYEGSVLPTPSAFISTPNAQTDAWVAITVLFLIAAALYKTRKPIIPAPMPAAKSTEVF